MNSPPGPSRQTRRIPSNSLFYDRFVPLVFILLAVITLSLILFAAGVLLGIVQYR
jgi:hypothetical protein